MPSILTTEIKASILRHRLFDRLDVRTDIVAPQRLAPSLARRIPRFIVAGLDDAREPGIGGWPVFTGGRYKKLCFSPIVEAFADENAGATHPLPMSDEAYVAYVEQITGIRRSDIDDFARIFRFDAVELFDACRAMRASCLPAWRLLLSNEHELATRYWPALGDVPPESQFQYPLVDAFRIIAEFERASLIMRHLARARTILDRPRFLEALASPHPLSQWYKPGELIEVCRWVEYACLSSRALTELLFERTVDEVAALPQGYALWAIARGEMPGAAVDVLDHPQVRAALIAVFSRPPLATPASERRKSVLRNDEILRWYGMTSEIIPIIALDDMRTRHPTRRARNAHASARRTLVAEAPRPVLGRLGSALRWRSDPAMQRKIAGASEKYLDNSMLAASHEHTLEGNVKTGLKLALFYLPPAPRLGSAARFDPAVWKNPRRDADLWRMLLDLRRGGQIHRRRHPARPQLRAAIGIIRRVYSPFFTNLQWSPEVERVICDMGTGLSPISGDPHIAFAIHALGRKPRLARRLGIQPRQGKIRRGKKTR